MTPKGLEQQLFSEGCVIEAEINLDDGSKVRLISTLKGGALQAPVPPQ